MITSLQSYSSIALTRFMCETILICLLQYIGYEITTTTNYLYPIWFVSGTAIAFIFLRGYYVLLGIWLGTSLAAYSFLSFSSATCVGLIIAIQTFSIFYLTQHFIYPSLYFFKRNQFFKFALLASFIAFPSAKLLHELIKAPNVSSIWLSNINGIIIAGMALVSLDAYFPELDHFTFRKISTWRPFLQYKLAPVSLFFFMISLVVNVLLYLGFTTLSSTLTSQCILISTLIAIFLSIKQ